MAKRGKKMILLVEDDEILLRALYLLFHGSKYAIASATDGESALQMTLRLKPSLVLLDLILPKLNGFDYLKDVKANPTLKHIPVVVLSNLGDRESVDRAITLGAHDYFVKSNTDLSTLVDKVSTILKA